MDAVGCIDGSGQPITHGAQFYPRTHDYCLSCTCFNGTQQRCLSAACAPPPNCETFQKVEKSCCTFTCTTPPISGYNGTDALSTAGVRLAATTASCIAIIIILLIVMHKLRRRRLLLSIRQGLRGGSGPSNAVMYTAAYDQVDIDITYRPLHTPGAPPPYSSSFDSAPPAYSTINKGGSGDTPTGIHTFENGVINSGCVATPPDSMYNIYGSEARAVLRRDEQTAVSHELADPFPESVVNEEISDSCNDLHSYSDVCSDSSLSQLESAGVEVNVMTGDSLKRRGVTEKYPLCEKLAVDLQSKESSALNSDHQMASNTNRPVSLSPHESPYSVVSDCVVKTPTYSMTSPYATPPRNKCKAADLRLNGTGKSGAGRSRSAGSSPIALRRYTDTSRQTVMTEYGFIDEGDSPMSDVVASVEQKVVGLSEEQLLDIASRKPERLNARVRRMNRIKRMSNPTPHLRNSSLL